MLGRSLEQLITITGIEDTLEYTFQIQHTTFLGDVVEVDLMPDGKSVPVTKENKGRKNRNTFYDIVFVKKYLEFIFKDGCKNEFDAFKSGFDAVLKESCITVYTNRRN
jgi:hypothetical protein